MPVDDIIEKVQAEDRQRQVRQYHTNQRRPGDPSTEDESVDEDTVPTNDSAVHDPRAHYDALAVKVNLDRDTAQFLSTVLNLVTGVIRLFG